MTNETDHFALASEIREAVKSGAIATAKRETLIRYSAWLCQRPSQFVINDAGEHNELSESVRLHLLVDFMRGAEKRSSRVQYVVIVLAVFSIIGTICQVRLGDKADKRAEADSVSSSQQRKESQSQTLVPNQAQPQTTRQVSSPASLPANGAPPAK